MVFWRPAPPKTASTLITTAKYITWRIENRYLAVSGHGKLFFLLTIHWVCVIVVPDNKGRYAMRNKDTDIDIHYELPRQDYDLLVARLAKIKSILSAGGSKKLVADISDVQDIVSRATAVATMYSTVMSAPKNEMDSDFCRRALGKYYQHAIAYNIEEDVDVGGWFAGHSLPSRLVVRGAVLDAKNNFEQMFKNKELVGIMAMLGRFKCKQRIDWISVKRMAETYEPSYDMWKCNADPVYNYVARDRNTGKLELREAKHWLYAGSYFRDTDPLQNFYSVINVAAGIVSYPVSGLLSRLVLIGAIKEK